MMEKIVKVKVIIARSLEVEQVKVGELVEDETKEMASLNVDSE